MTVAAVEQQTIRPNRYQARVLAAPESVDIFLGGSRGPGKSVAQAMLALSHAERYRDKARILYVRKSFPGVSDFVELTRWLHTAAYGQSASYNSTSHIWTLPTQSYYEIGMLAEPRDYARFQGRSFTLILVDEAGQWPEPEMLDALRSNLRSSGDVPVRYALAANPGGVGHHWLRERYVSGRTPWVPYTEKSSGRPFITAPGYLRENEFIDRDAYESQLRAATAGDPELQQAWIEGSWDVVRGAFFSDCIGELVALDEHKWASEWFTSPRERPWPGCEDPLKSSGRDWDAFIAYDHGSSAPAVCFLVLISPGVAGPCGRWIPRDSLCLVDEFSTNQPGSWSKGTGITVPAVADGIRAMCARWGVEPRGVADDAIFANIGSSSGSIATEFSSNGVRFAPAGKGDRASGWSRMRTMLSNSSMGDTSVPGLFVSRRCRGWWATVPVLGRDARRVEDVDSAAADHWADASRYAITGRPWGGGPLVQEFRI